MRRRSVLKFPRVGVTNADATLASPLPRTSTSRTYIEARCRGRYSRTLYSQSRPPSCQLARTILEARKAGHPGHLRSKRQLPRGRRGRRDSMRRSCAKEVQATARPPNLQAPAPFHPCTSTATAHFTPFQASQDTAVATE